MFLVEADIKMVYQRRLKLVHFFTLLRVPSKCWEMHSFELGNTRECHSLIDKHKTV